MKTQIDTHSSDSKPTSFFERLEKIMERMFWTWRFSILLAIFGFLFISAITFMIGTLEAFVVMRQMISQVTHHGIHFPSTIYNDILMTLILVIDNYLLATVLLILGLGIYDLFISPLKPADKQADIRPDWLRFDSIHELKATLAKVILMTAIVQLLKSTEQVSFKEPLDILYLGAAIGLVGVAIKLSYREELEQSMLHKRIERGINK